MPPYKTLGALIITASLSLAVYFFSDTDNAQKNFTFYGNVDIREVALGFRVPGRLLKMNYEEGNHLSQGKIMAQLDQDTYLEDIALAKAQLLEAQAAFNNAKRLYLRRIGLVKTGAVSKSLFDQSKANYEQAKAQVETAKVTIKKAQTALNDTYLKAPTSGHILTRVKEPGSIINQGQTVYTLTVDNPIWVRVFIDEDRLGTIYPGQKALVYNDTFPNKPYHGHVGYIASQAEFTPKTVETTQLRTDLVYRFRIVVDNPDMHLRQGMPVTVKVLP